MQLLQYSAKPSTGMEGKIRENQRNKRGNDGGDSCSNDSADSSSVARGGGGFRAPPIGLRSMQNRTFLVLLWPSFGEKLKTAPPKEIGCRSCEVHVVIRPEKALEFAILAGKSVSISVKIFFWRPLVFGLKKRSIFQFWPDNQFQFR